jgi:hypothetical protein
MCHNSVEMNYFCGLFKAARFQKEKICNWKQILSINFPTTSKAIQRYKKFKQNKYFIIIERIFFPPLGTKGFKFEKR